MLRDNLFVNRRGSAEYRRRPPGSEPGRRGGQPQSSWSAGRVRSVNPSGADGNSRESQEER